MSEPTQSSSRGRAALRRIGGVLVVVLTTVGLPAAVFGVNAALHEAGRYTPPPSAAVPAETPKAHDPAKPTAVIVVGEQGANISDALVPYELLAGTGAFNVYTVARERRPVPLLGGVDLVPDLSFSALAERLGPSAPAVTVVPEMPTDPDGDAVVAGFVRDTADRGGLVLGVCSGARLVAKAGLLDGRPATSHWYRLASFAGDHPQVQWQRGTRYIDDGDVITTGGLLSSFDGTLRVIERLLGTEVATSTARTIDWPSYTPGTPAPLPVSTLTPLNATTHILNVGFRATFTTIGVAVTDGVGEIELSSAFAPYGEVKSARTVALSPGGQPVRSRHGLTLLPRGAVEGAQVDRLLAPGRNAALPPTATSLHEQPGFAFDAALREMARSQDVPTARWTAKILEYQPDRLRLEGARWPWGPTMFATALALVGLAAGLIALRLLRRRANA